jgi:SAM-dependent methyltransferase
VREALGVAGDAARRWSELLTAWTIPQELIDAAPESPYGFPVELFARRADELGGRDTPSRRRAAEALQPAGSVLDVGCGAGAAGLALVPPAGRVVGVDEMPAMLDELSHRAEAKGADHAELVGRWPDVETEAPVTDVVVCHHVIYNVADLAPFAVALARHARRRVVVESTQTHSLSWMDQLWKELHGIDRPPGPTVDDAAEAMREGGIELQVERWEDRFFLADLPLHQAVAFVRRRLCLGPDRDAEVEEALRRVELPRSRPVATIWWEPATLTGNGR